MHDSGRTFLSSVLARFKVGPQGRDFKPAKINPLEKTVIFKRFSRFKSDSLNISCSLPAFRLVSVTLVYIYELSLTVVDISREQSKN